MKPILGYFKLRGWAGPIRLLLAYLEVDYDENLYQLPVPEPINDQINRHQCSYIDEHLKDWKAEKHTLGLQFPNLPYWIEDKIKITETKAILRYIARSRNCALLGVTANDEANVNVLEEFLWEMWNSLCQVCLKNYDEAVGNFLNASKSKFELLSKNLTREWAIGSYITVADFLLYEIIYHYNVFCSSLLHSAPALQHYMSRFENIPQICSCINSQKFIKGPCFSSKFISRL